MAVYRKKPIEINASKWLKNGDHLKDYSLGTPLGYEGEVVRYYRVPDPLGDVACKQCQNVMHVHGWIDTLEGGHIVCPGDWVITGIKGELYPCKPDIFAATYEPV